MHVFEGLVPARSCFGCRPHDQLSLLHDKVNGSMQLALFNDRFRNSDPPGIPDSYDMRLHIFFVPLFGDVSTV